MDKHEDLESDIDDAITLQNKVQEGVASSTASLRVHHIWLWANATCGLKPSPQKPARVCLKSNTPTPTPIASYNGGGAGSGEGSGASATRALS